MQNCSKGCRVVASNHARLTGHKIEYLWDTAKHSMVASANSALKFSLNKHYNTCTVTLFCKKKLVTITQQFNLIHLGYATDKYGGSQFAYAGEWPLQRLARPWVTQVHNMAVSLVALLFETVGARFMFVVIVIVRQMARDVSIMAP